MKNIFIKGLFVSVCVVSMTSSAFAVWWNPMTWFKQKPKITQNETVEIVTPKIVATSSVMQTSSTNKQKEEKSLCGLGEACSYFKNCSPHVFEKEQLYVDVFEIQGVEGDLCKIHYQFNALNTEKTSGYRVDGNCLVDTQKQDGDISGTVGVSLWDSFITVNNSFFLKGEINLKKENTCKVEVKKLSESELSDVKKEINNKIKTGGSGVVKKIVENGSKITSEQSAQQKIKTLRESIVDVHPPKDVVLPAMPDNEINDSTLSGVDSNNNGVRDDVERLLAKNAKSGDEFKYMLSLAKEYEKQITNPIPKNRDEALNVVVKQMCVYEEASKNGIKIKGIGDDATSLYVNTAERKNALKKFNTVLIAFSPREMNEDSCK